MKSKIVCTRVFLLLIFFLVIFSLAPIKFAEISAASASLVGDVNLNGTVDIGDAMFIAQYTASNRQLSSTALNNADVDGDGKINEIDAKLIAQWLAKKFDNLPRISSYRLNAPNPNLLFGDANLDGKIDTFDALSASQAVAGEKELAGTALSNADVDGDGKITDIDAKLIGQYDAKLISKFPRQEAPAALLVGDANLNGQIDVGDAMFISQSAAGNRQLIGAALSNADVNGDGKAATDDADQISQYLVGKIAKFTRHDSYTVKPFSYLANLLPDPKIFADQNSAFAAPTLAPGMANARIGSFILAASAAEGINVNSITIKTNLTANNIVNLKLFTGGVQVGTTRAALSSNDIVVFNGLPVTVPAGGQKIIDVYADIKTKADTGLYGPITTLAGCGGVGQTSANSGSCLPTNIAGQAVSVYPPAVKKPDLTINLDAANSVARDIAVGKNDVEVIRFKLTATGEDIKVGNLTLATSIGKCNFSKLKLFNGSTQVGSTVVSASSGNGVTCNAEFSNLNFMVPKDSSRVLALKLSIPFSAVNGDKFAFGVYGAYIPLTSSGKLVSITGIPKIGNEMTVVSSTPSITVLSPNGGESWVAGNSYDIKWKKSDFIQGVSIYLSNSNGDETPIVSPSVTNLGNGVFSNPWQIPNSLPAGQYLIKAQADNLPYSDTSDARFSIVAANNKPDFFADDIRMPIEAKTGEEIIAEFDVLNRGTATSSGPIAWKLQSTDANMKQRIILNGCGYYNLLRPQSGCTVKLGLTYSRAGSMNNIMTFDTLNKYDESSETNNTSERTITVTAATSDSNNKYPGFYIDPSKKVYQAGEILTVTFRRADGKSASYPLNIYAQKSASRGDSENYLLRADAPVDDSFIAAFDIDKTPVFASGGNGNYIIATCPVSGCAMGASNSNIIKIEGFPEKAATDTQAQNAQIQTITSNAKLMKDDKFSQILAELQQLRDLVKEQQTQIKYLNSLVKDVGDLSTQAMSAINNFITYGVDANTKKLGAGERAAVINSYKSAFDKLPQTEAELADAIKIANGRFPSITSDTAEKDAKDQFVKIYKRAPDLNNPKDNAAIKVMAYGLRQKAENRNLNSEKAGIKIFTNIYGRAPATTEDWNTMQAITYSGAKR